MDDKEILGAISIEIGIVDDHLDRFENEGIEFLEALKEEWKVLYNIREILEISPEYYSTWDHSES